MPLLAASLFLLTACQTDNLPGTAGDDGDGNGQPTPEELVAQPINFGGLTVTEITTDADTRAVTRIATTPYVPPGATLTIKMTVTPGATPVTTYADYTCTDAGLWQPTGKPLYWADLTSQHTFTAYSPALTDEEKSDGRSTVSLPLSWNQELYETYGTYMAGAPVTSSITATVSLSLVPLLTRIEVKMKDDAVSYARYLTMLTKTRGVISNSGGSTTATPASDAPVQEMNFWKTTDNTVTGAPTIFRGYTLPQTYAQDDILLLHYDPGVADAQVYKPSNSGGLTTLPGTIVTFTVTALTGETLNVPTAGGLKDALDAYASSHSGNYPSRLKITGELNKADLTALTTTNGILTVDLAEATVPDAAFGTGSSSSSETPFYLYVGSIKNLVLPGAMKTIPANAFSNSKLEGIVLPGGVTTIGDYAFSSSSINTLEVPASVVSVGSAAFANCEKLTTAIIHCRLKNLGGSAFSGDSHLSTVICVGEALQSTEVIRYMFYGAGLTSLDFLPLSIERFNDSAFGGCQSLVDAVIPARVNFINNAFSYNPSLKRIALDGTVDITINGSVGSNFAKSPELFLYNTGLTESDSRVAPFTGNSWGNITWANVHWGYKGTGSKCDVANYNYHKNP